MKLSGIKAALMRKVGPLPLGAWLAILVLGVLIARYIRNRNAGNSQDTNANQGVYDDPGIGFGDGGGGTFIPGDPMGGDPTPNPPGGTGGGPSPDPGLISPGDEPAPNPSTEPDPGVNPGGANQPITDPNVTHDAPTRITTPSGTKIFDDGATQTSVSKGSRIVSKFTDETSKVLTSHPSPSVPLAAPTRTTPALHPSAPELISEHGSGQNSPRPAAPKSSPAVVRAAPALVSEHGQGGGFSPAPAPLLSQASSAGHSVAIAPSAAPSTVGVARTSRQARGMGRKGETE